MKDIPKVWYPAKSTTNGAIIEDGVMGHLYWKDAFLCKGNKDAFIAEAKADKGMMRGGAIPYHPICPKCEKVYKANPSWPWNKWEQSTLGKEGKP